MTDSLGLSKKFKLKFLNLIQSEEKKEEKKVSNSTFKGVVIRKEIEDKKSDLKHLNNSLFNIT